MPLKEGMCSCQISGREINEGDLSLITCNGPSSILFQNLFQKEVLVPVSTPLILRERIEEMNYCMKSGDHDMHLGSWILVPHNCSVVFT
jgi:hypothetical protein